MKLRYENQLSDLVGVKAVIFDMDGTLVESEPIWAEAKLNIAKSLGIDVDEQVLAAYVGRSVVDFVREIINPADVKFTVAKITERALSRYDYQLSEISGAAELVNSFSMKGFVIAICSSASEKAIQKSLAMLGIESCVGTVVSTASLPKGKPDKLPYVETLRRLGISPEMAIVFEDSKTGVASSVSAGIRTIWVGDTIDAESFDCAMYVEKIDEIEIIDR